MNNLPFGVAVPAALGTFTGWIASLFTHGNEVVPALTSIATVLLTALLRAWFDRRRDYCYHCENTNRRAVNNDPPINGATSNVNVESVGARP